MQLVLVKIKARSLKAIKIQEVLTKHGCNIGLRLGLHEIADEACTEDGLIMLKVKSDQHAVTSLVTDLQSIEDVEVKAVSF